MREFYGISKIAVALTYMHCVLRWTTQHTRIHTQKITLLASELTPNQTNQKSLILNQKIKF